ncbi:putative pentatricopeptide repeat-containing protein At3g49142 [Arachis hypogaea]|uniref:putative pentatricopeptide repeat-containing protein At3g49142 n=1 Tax=Arachis hypogaea TaxID=3818 RepID=UPI003B2187E8
MIGGLVNADHHINALALFDSMLKAGIEVKNATVMSVLRACAETEALSVEKKVHMIVKEKRIDSKANVCTTLVDMYAKSGCLKSARNVFDNVMDKDVFVWTAMISALASHGMF